MIAYNGFLNGLTKVHYGGHDLSMVYYGNHKVFPSDTPTPPASDFKWKAIFEITAHTESAACGSSSEIVASEVPPPTRKYYGSKYYFTILEVGDCVLSIAQNVFSNYGLLKVSISKNVATIGDGCFQNCTYMQSITCFATTPPVLGTAVFDNTNEAPIYVPASAVGTYKSASGWSSYASRIRAIQ